MLPSLSRFRPGLHSGNFISFRLLILYFFASFSVIFFATGFLSSIFSTLWFFIHRFSLPQASCLLSFPPRPSYPRFSLSLVFLSSSFSATTFLSAIFFVSGFLSSILSATTFLSAIFFVSRLLILDLLPRPSYPRFSLYLVSYLRASPPRPFYPRFSLSLASYLRASPPRPFYPRFSLSLASYLRSFPPRPFYPRFSLSLASYLRSFPPRPFIRDFLSFRLLILERFRPAFTSATL